MADVFSQLYIHIVFTPKHRQSLIQPDWNVLQDVLEGGYGLISYNEKYRVVWQNYSVSKERLSPNDLKKIKDLFEFNPNITLELE